MTSDISFLVLFFHQTMDPSSMDSGTSPAQVAAARDSHWGSWTIGAASVTCVGQQEPVKEVRYMAFWSRYRIVAINGAKDSSFLRKQEVTESEHEEKAEERWLIS